MIQVSVNHRIRVVLIHLQIGVGIHDIPGADNTQMIDPMAAHRGLAYLFDNCPERVSSDGTNDAIAHAGVDHLHIYKKQVIHRIDLVGFSTATASSDIVEGLGEKSSFGQSATVDRGIFQSLGNVQSDSACPANDLTDAENLFAAKKMVFTVILSIIPL